MFGWGDSGEGGKGREENSFRLFGWEGKMGGILGGPKCFLPKSTKNESPRFREEKKRA